MVIAWKATDVAHHLPLRRLLLWRLPSLRPVRSAMAAARQERGHKSRLKLRGEERHNPTTATDTMDHGHKECKTAGHVMVLVTAIGHECVTYITYLNTRISENQWTWLLAWVGDGCGHGLGNALGKSFLITA